MIFILNYLSNDTVIIKLVRNLQICVNMVKVETFACLDNTETDYSRTCTLSEFGLMQRMK